MKIQVILILITLLIQVSCLQIKTNEKMNMNIAERAVQFRIARPTNQLLKIKEFCTEGLGMKEIGSFTEHQGYSGLMLGCQIANIIWNSPNMKMGKNCHNLQKKIFLFYILIPLKNMKWQMND